MTMQRPLPIYRTASQWNCQTQEATVSSCQPTRLKLWAESFGQQPVCSPKRQPATTWDPIQLLQRTLHPIMNSKTKIVYDNTTDKKVCLLSREIVQKKLTTLLCKIRP